VVAFRIVQRVAAPPAYVVGWWLDYSQTDVQLTRGIVERRVDRIDERRTHLRTTSVFGGRERTTEGIVTRTGPTTWVMEGHVSSRGRVVSSMRSAYRVEAEVAGSRVVTDFEFVGKTLGWRVAIAFASPALVRRQRASFRDYAAGIERDYRASGAGPSGGALPTEHGPAGPG